MWNCKRWSGRRHDKMEGFMRRGRRQRQPGGNHAFDEYRQETLRRLDDEQREFNEFLTRLRMAEDKAEFDQFLSNRKARPSVPSVGTGTIDRAQS